MDRPPRNAQTDRLVNFRLISFAYLQIGMIQALRASLSTSLSSTTYATPNILMGNGWGWAKHSVMCTINGDGSPKECGFGCEAEDYEPGYCEGGCQVPSSNNIDPFVEFTASGFRGAGDYTCNRACSNYADIPDDKITADERDKFVDFCARDQTWGFSDRGWAHDDAKVGGRQVLLERPATKLAE